ncbi:MAG: nuclear transport factor 2 family protein [Pseudomonadales bacterium]|nr:nuclear transport factor 2 family protein [Pseudomonadales bacterium]
MDLELDVLQLQIQRLTDIEAIRHLKAAYYHACDQKAIGSLAQCFAEGEIWIDYGVVGTFSSREDFIRMFEEQACHDHIVDTHHGQNAQISWQSPSKATAISDLYFHQINTKAQTLTQLSGFYHDTFINDGDGWKIQETIFKVTSSLVSKLDDGKVQVLFAGSAPDA